MARDEGGLVLVGRQENRRRKELWMVGKGIRGLSERTWPKEGGIKSRGKDDNFQAPQVRGAKH